MNMNIFNFIKQVINLLTSGVSFKKEVWAWCPVRVNNRINK